MSLTPKELDQLGNELKILLKLINLVDDEAIDLSMKLLDAKLNLLKDKTLQRGFIDRLLTTAIDSMREVENINKDAYSTLLHFMIHADSVYLDKIDELVKENNKLKNELQLLKS